MNKYKVRTITCEFCGKTVTKRMPEGRRFCSFTCSNHAPKPERMNGIYKTCEQCHREFYVPKNRKDARFCSPDCLNEWQGRNKIEYACVTCGKTFKKSPSHQKFGNIKYCSIACRDNDPNHLEHLIQMNVAQQSLKPNSLELAGYGILDEIGVEYESQCLIAKKFCVDALIPSAKVVIQFDGDYWHAHPDKFPNPDKRQQKRIALDNSQDAYMKKLGYRVIRIWEHDIKHSPESVRIRLATEVSANHIH